jgi:hypothetical protein
MKYRILALAAGALMLSAGAASAATVANDLNLRAGPGTSYSVIAALPAGADVDVLNCTGNWCQVNWQGTVGFASASYLDEDGDYAASSAIYSDPLYDYDYAFAGPRFYGFHHGYHVGFHGGYHGGFHGGYHGGGFHGGFHGGGFHGGGFHGGGFHGGGFHGGGFHGGGHHR